MTALESFHAHLDCCAQCRNNPFGLCSRGFSLLGRAAGMRDDGHQAELPLGIPPEVSARPFVRMAWDQAGRSK